MFKRGIFIFIGIILAIYGAYSYFTRTEKIDADVIVALGDSLTAGYGATEGNDYVSRLEDLLDKEIINMGVSGDTTAGVLARIDAVIERDPDLVILFIGGNDVLRKVSRNQMFTNIEEIIVQLKESGAQVVLVGIPGGILSDPFDDVFEDVAKKYDLIYIPEFMGGLIRGREYMYDSIHPNDEGYRIVAEKIYEGIKGRVK